MIARTNNRRPYFRLRRDKVLAAVGISLLIVLAALGYFFDPRWVVASAALLGLYAIGSNYLVWRLRRRCHTTLLGRGDAILGTEENLIAARGNMDLSDAERLYNGFASFYKIPPAKLRAKDRLRYELRGLFVDGDADRDIWHRSAVIGHDGKALDLAEQLLGQPNADLADMLTVIREYEIQTGRNLVNIAQDKEGRSVYQWSD